MSKLYTEEQVRILLKDLLGLDKSVNEAIDSLEPIQLPTYEEIDIANEYGYYGKHNGGKYLAFNEGAKWMRDKILNFYLR